VSAQVVRIGMLDVPSLLDKLRSEYDAGRISNLLVAIEHPQDQDGGHVMSWETTATNAITVYNARWLINAIEQFMFSFQ